MPDVPRKPPPEPTQAQRVNAKAQEVLFLSKSVAVEFVTGDPRGSVRRPILFVVAGLSLVLGWPAIGLVALLLLAWTDQPVEP